MYKKQLLMIFGEFSGLAKYIKIMERLMFMDFMDFGSDIFYLIGACICFFIAKNL